jgi:hypothetical protein
MVEPPADRKAGDGGALASRRLSVVLALAFSPQPRRTENHSGASETHSIHGSGEPALAAPRIHGELLKLGFEISECTASRYLGEIDRRRDSGKGWLAFLKNHREAIAAMDLFAFQTRRPWLSTLFWSVPPSEPSSCRRHSSVLRLFTLRVRFQHCGSILSTEVAPDSKLMKPP